MTNLSASDLTKLTVLIDGQPRGRLATTAKTVERLTKTLAEALGDPDAATKVLDRALNFETYGGAEAILKAALKGSTANVAAPAAVETGQTGTPETAAPALTSDAQRRRTKATAAMDAAKTGTLPVPGLFGSHPRPVSRQARGPDRPCRAGRHRRPARGPDQPGLVEPQGARPLPRSLRDRA
ncbi:MAG: hypothetical protein IOD05_10930 [Rhodobacter sp.]|nr:hypothetical protein [Rhodobacter sp.]